jgi:hypothetical protein
LAWPGDSMLTSSAMALGLPPSHRSGACVDACARRASVLRPRTAHARPFGFASHPSPRLRCRRPPLPGGGLPRLREVRGARCASRPFVRCTGRWLPTFRLPCAFKALLRRRVRGAADRCRPAAPVPSLGFLPLRGSPSTAGGPPPRPEGRSCGASIPPPIRPEPVPEGADTGVDGVCPVGGCRGCPR